MREIGELGNFERKHAPSNAFKYFAIGVFIVFTGICGFIYFGGILPVLEGKSRFNGDISILYWVMVFIMALAVVILLTAFLLTKGPSFYLYERGIISDHKGKKKTTLFTEMQDVYTFISGPPTGIINNIAYRMNEQDEWQVLTTRYTKIEKAINFITQQQHDLYVPQVMEQLANGKSVPFHYINSSTVWNKRIFATGTKSFIDVKAKELIVSSEHIIIDSKTINLNELSHFSINDWFNQVVLHDKQGNVILKIAFSGLFSGYSFVTVLDKLINK